MLLILAALCGLIEAVFTALEIALATVSRARLRSLASPTPGRDEAPESPKTVRAASVVLELLERPDRLTLLFICVTSLSLWAAASLLTWHTLRGDWPLWALALALVGLLFCAEVLPLLIAARAAEDIALRGSGLVKLAQKILAPLTFCLGEVAYGAARILGSGPNATPHVTESELRTALAAAEEEGVIESDERALIEGAMDLRDKTVREVMTARAEIQDVATTTLLLDALQKAIQSGHSRLPVFENSSHQIVGILATKDLLPHLKNGDSGEKTVLDVMRAPFFLPENRRIDASLEELRRQRTLMAIVVDENGETAGLVTLEDLLEELVGEIQDEYDVEEEPFRIEGEGDARFVIGSASSSVREFGRFFAPQWKMTPTLRDASGAAAASGTSLAALALELFGKAPAGGDAIRIGEAVATTPDIRAEFGLKLEITRMNDSQIEEVRIFLVGDTE